MRVITGGDRASTREGPFTGVVELEMLNATPASTDPDTAFGHFYGGAVTNWHHHPGGQLLFVVSGRGRVGTEEDDPLELEPGTLVVAPPSEAHWHGAASGSDCTMLAVTWGTTCWHDGAAESQQEKGPAGKRSPDGLASSPAGPARDSGGREGGGQEQVRGCCL